MIATTAVAIVAVLATAAASLPLISLAVDLQVRQELAVETAALAAESPAARAAAIAASGPGRTRLAEIGPTGQASGPAARLLPAHVRAEARSGRTVSTTTDAGGRSFVESGRAHV